MVRQTVQSHIVIQCFSTNWLRYDGLTFDLRLSLTMQGPDIIQRLSRPDTYNVQHIYGKRSPLNVCILYSGQVHFQFKGIWLQFHVSVSFSILNANV